MSAFSVRMKMTIAAGRKGPARRLLLTSACITRKGSIDSTGYLRLNDNDNISAQCFGEIDFILIVLAY
jgi:hypothetical protein